MNLKVDDVARLMKKSPQFIRVGLQRGLLPIGHAIQNPGGKYSYYISPKLFEEYTGIKVEQDKEKENDLATN